MSRIKLTKIELLQQNQRLAEENNRLRHRVAQLELDIEIQKCYYKDNNRTPEEYVTELERVLSD